MLLKHGDRRIRHKQILFAGKVVGRELIEVVDVAIKYPVHELEFDLAVEDRLRDAFSRFHHASGAVARGGGVIRSGARSGRHALSARGPMRISTARPSQTIDNVMKRLSSPTRVARSPSLHSAAGVRAGVLIPPPAPWAGRWGCGSCPLGPLR